MALKILTGCKRWERYIAKTNTRKPSFLLLLFLSIYISQGLQPDKLQFDFFKAMSLAVVGVAKPCSNVSAPRLRSRLPEAVWKNGARRPESAVLRVRLRRVFGDCHQRRRLKFEPFASESSKVVIEGSHGVLFGSGKAGVFVERGNVVQRARSRE